MTTPQKCTGAALALVMLLASGLPCRAQQLSERYQEFLASDLYRLLIISKWDQQARLICGERAGRSGLGLGQLIELEPVQGAGDKPTSGAWIHRVPGNTCGKRRTFNILVEFGDQGPLLGLLLPGETLAHPLLQKDALRAAESACRLKAKECEVPLVIDTVQAGPMRGVPGGWVEYWYFDACGQIVVVSMLFAPDGQGGTSYQAR